MNLEELKKKTPAELISQAEKLEIENPSTLRKRNISKKAQINKINQKIYATIGAVGNSIPSNSYTDFNAVKHGYISITPLNIDMSDYEIISKLKKYE